jgi:hypothetical protein
MIKEQVSITLQCDRKRCFGLARVTEDTRDLCSLLLFEMGWRLCNDRQICPQCAARRDARVARMLR